MAWVLAAAVSASAAAQGPPVHYRHSASMPPGAIGTEQLQRGGPLPCYFQPVRVRMPAEAKVSVAVRGAFSPAAGELLAGLQIGRVYRLRITNIPLRPGEEVFPTVEVINRTYPPPGTELRFPIEIELTRDDLEQALAGRFVVKVIYLEDPRTALPVAAPDEQIWQEVAPGRDPLLAADVLGRPVAILRMGGRVPDLRGGIDQEFLYGSPPLLLFPPRPTLPAPQLPQQQGQPPAEATQPLPYLPRFPSP